MFSMFLPKVGVFNVTKIYVSRTFSFPTSLFVTKVLERHFATHEAGPVDVDTGHQTVTLFFSV